MSELENDDLRERLANIIATEAHGLGLIVLNPHWQEKVYRAADAVLLEIRPVPSELRAKIVAAIESVVIGYKTTTGTEDDLEYAPLHHFVDVERAADAVLRTIGDGRGVIPAEVLNAIKVMVANPCPGLGGDYYWEIVQDWLLTLEALRG